jgi:outer membrane protein assembly factor BamB
MVQVIHPAVVPVLVGPLQVLLAILPGLVLALGSLLLAMLKPSAMRKALALAWRLKAPLVGVALLVAGGCYCVRALMPVGRSVSAKEAARSEWTMFRGGPQRCGAVPGAASVNEPGLVWAATPAGEAFYASPAVLGNRLYVTSAQYGVFKDRGAVYCLDADTGRVVWQMEPDGFRATFSSPAISADGRYLVCGEGLHLTDNARVFCLDISDETLKARGEPRLAWSHRTKSHVESSPAVVGGRVYIGAGNDGYYCFDLAGDGSGGARVLWHKPGAAYPDAESPPLVHAGRVYVGLGLRGNAVACLDTETGDEIWRAETPYPVFGSCTLMEEPEAGGPRLYFGMGVGDFVNTAEAFAEKELAKLRAEGASPAELEAARARYRPAGEVWCLDAESGRRLWRRAVDRAVLGAVAAAGDRLFCGSRDGHVYALRRSDGEIVARFNAREPVIASPACTETHVFAVTTGGRLFALDRETLEARWSMPFGAGGRALSSPCAARGHVYVGSEKAGLLCLGRAGETGPGPRWEGYLADSRHSGAVGRPSLPARGSRLCQFPAAGAGGQPSPATVTAPPALLAGHLYVALDGGGGGPRLVALPEGEKRAFGEPVWRYEAPNAVSLSPAADSANVYVVDGAKGDPGRRLHGLDRATGAVRWTHAVAAEASGAFGLRGESIYVMDRPGRLSRLTTGGQPLWRREIGESPWAPDVRGAIVVAATRAPVGLVALDCDSGAVLWQVAPAPQSAPVVHKQTVLVSTAGGMEARSLVDGSVRWRTDGGAGASALVLSAGTLACTAGDGTVTLLSPDTGEVRRTLGGAVAGLPPLVADDMLIYARPEALMMARPDRPDEPAEWMDTSWLGKLTTPMAAAGPYLYFGMNGRGLVRAGAWE